MDDLSGLNWSAPNPAKKPTQSIPSIPATNIYPSLRPNPSPLNSGRNTPLSTQGSGTAAFKAPAPAPTSKPAGDSFSNLLNFGTGKSNANLSLRERQEQIEAEKRKKEEERRKQAQAQFGDGRFLETLGQSSSASLRTPSPSIAPPPIAFGAIPSFGSSSAIQNGKAVAESDDDLFAAFKAETKVDNSSHFPPPAPSPAPPAAPTRGLDLRNPNAWGSTGGLVDDDDDPFGLNQLSHPKARAPAPPPPADDDDDLLGDLGKPVDQVRKKTAPTFARQPEPGKAIEDDSSSDSEPEQPTAASSDPFDRAVAQLMDYGFSAEDARRGLTESGAGLDVQATVNWLLDDAHRRAKEQAKAKKRGGAGAQVNESHERASSQPRSGAPSWIGPLPGDGSRTRNNQSPSSADGDFAKTAAAVGTTLFKTANSLWKTGQKKVQKAVAEFQQDGGDPNQPKWMRQQERVGSDSRRQVPDVTDEAMMLEGGGPSARKSSSRTPSNAPPRDRSPALPVRPAQGSQSKWQQQSQPALDPRARLAKQAVEEESFQAYVSPSRRKKATPQPQSEPDLLFGGSSAPIPSRSTPTPPVRSAQPSPAPRPAARQTPVPRPAPARPPRQIPHLSAIALQSSNKHRLEGTAHFKRGDYAAAHASYASSLSAIPQDHPLAILLLCNRALTALKTGEPRQAVSDADAAIKLIGEGKGEGEQVDVQGENGNNEKREMRDLYGKALTRKAEALEQMEKWKDALDVWQLCVQSNLGGATAAAGRQRCQKALAPKQPPRPPAARPAAASRPKPTPSPSGGQKSAEAVQRLREANQAAAREGDEKIALTDKVDARIAAWRDGKRDNLRALLSSMDNVLWEGSGWKKVGLAELVMPNKVKIVYMKAIAKTHPDKIAQDATTEVRMIAGTVFSTLNEAWDKFKVQNNL
ncbi:UBA domain-containing protein 7 [Podospora fimiseda]|uniref:UBA domain-containing protein 7 n=1 Tax=Podospora fimiseda TaxID=252190 RepID=A0AAN7H0Z2_9PEZI|nr:UBA domain-containing protein 7 [Podospora fimiseda]